MLKGDEKCDACQEDSHECWVYSSAGAKQVARPGDTCARCRIAARKVGCSLLKRGPKRRRRSGSPGPGSLPHIRPGPPPPPPGAGGAPVAV